MNLKDFLEKVSENTVVIIRIKDRSSGSISSSFGYTAASLLLDTAAPSLLETEIIDDNVKFATSEDKKLIITITNPATKPLQKDENPDLDTVYSVMSEGHILGLFKTMESAEKMRDDYEHRASMNGSRSYLTIGKWDVED